MRVKYLKTESRLYTEHLEIKRESPLTFSVPKDLPLLKTTPIQSLQTNFSISLKNQYAFILLHLKKLPQTKNVLTINIPQTCIFYNHQPYQILYNDNSQIRSYRGKEGMRLKQVFTFFKTKWKQKGLNKQQPSVACFQRQEYLMMTDTDFFITCRKFKNDPFFHKLAYIRSKVNAVDNPIKVEYEALLDTHFTGQATQSLLNIQNEKNIFEKYGEHGYLKYCNVKICLFLNYEHNIRVSKATFYYLKSNNNEYFLVNVSHLEFTNLTKALKQRQKREKVKEQLRNQCLFMSSEKQQRYKRHEKSANVKIIQTSMNQSWLKVAENLRIRTNEQRIREQQRNQLAFHRLYPHIQQSFDVALTGTNFKKLKRDLFKFQTRRPLFKSNYRQVQHSNRCVTESLQINRKRQ